jgi:hypothetical protein
MGSNRKRNKGRRRATPRGHWRQEDDAPLHVIVRRAIAHPFQLLAVVSLLMLYSDPERSDPFRRSGESKATPWRRAELIASLIEDPAPETSALLAVFAEFVDDEQLTEKIRAELGRRSPLTRKWLVRLGQTRIHRAMRISHVLDETDIMLLQGRMPSAGTFTCVVQLDVDYADVIREAVFMRAPMEKVLPMIKPQSDFRCEEVDLADARARLLKAIRFDSLVPAREKETWPQNRALMKWLIKTLPDGGSALPRPEWSLVEIDSVVRRFLESPQGKVFSRRHVPLCESLVEFGGDCAPGDPMRWNEWRVERWLFDHLLDRYDFEYVPGWEAAPYLLRAFIRFAHDEVGVRSELTDEVVASIDAWEPQYQREIRRKLDEDDGFDAAVQPNTA